MLQNLAPVALVLLPILVFMVYVWWSGRARLKSPRTEKLPGQKLQIDGRVTQIERELLVDNDRSYPRYRLSYDCCDGIMRFSIWHYEIDDPLAVLISLEKVQEGSTGIVMVHQDQEREVATGFRVGLTSQVKTS